MNRNYLVLNPMLSVRASADRRRPDYERFIDWPAGSIMGPAGTDYPAHTPIEEWLRLGYIQPIEVTESGLLGVSHA